MQKSLKTLLIASTLVASTAAFGITKEEDFFNKAKAAFEKGNYQRSFKIFRYLLYNNPDNVIYKFNIANSLLALKKYELAAKYYTKVVRSGSDLELPALYYVSKSYSEMGKFKNATYVLGIMLDRNLPKGLYDMVLDELERLADLGKEEEMYNAGKELFKDEQYEAAFEHFRLAWIIDPSSSNYFMLGYSRLKLGDIQGARYYFSKIKDDNIFYEAKKILSAATRKSSQSEIIDLEDEEDVADVVEENKWSLYLDAFRGTNSNPSTQADSAEFESDSETIFAAGTSYLLHQKGNFTIKASIDGYYDAMASDDTNKTSAMGVSAPLAWNYDNYSFDLTPRIEKTRYAGTDYLNTGSATATYTKYSKKTKRAYTYTYSNYSEGLSDYAYLAGTSHKVDYSQTRYLESSDLTFGFSFESVNLIDSEDSTGSKKEFGFSLSYYYPFASRFSFEPSFSYDHSFYDTDADNFNRIDKTFTLIGQIYWSWGSNFSLYAKAQMIRNQSNLENTTDDYNYSQRLVGAGFFTYF